MNLAKIILRWVHSLGNRRAVKKEIDEELRFHVEQRTAEKVNAGMSPEEAAREARKRFGNAQSVREECREARGANFGETILQDVRFGLRMLAKNPGFSVVAVLTLALGIGANTAIFSLVNGVLLKPLPYEQPGQLVQVWEAPEPGKRATVSPGAFLDWKENNTVFESLSLRQDVAMNLTDDGEPESVNGLGMSASGLQILRARLLLGRIFTPDEDQPGKDKVVVLTQGFWQRRFGGDTNIVGRAIELAGESYTVIGILPQRFLPWDKAEFVVPTTIAPKDANERGADWLQVIGRLKPGVSVEHGQAEMNALAARLRPLYPVSRKDWGVTLVPLNEQVTGDIKPTLLVLLGAVGFVFLIACANVANLLLARASGRQGEIAIRIALGASRGRLVRQLLVESVLLSLLGAVLGLVMAFWGVSAIRHLTWVNLPRANDVSLDLRVLGFALVVSLLAALGFGIVPALQASHPNLSTTLKDAGRSSGMDARNRVRSALVISEVALALVLLTGAGLLLNSFFRLSNVPAGINPEHALTMQVTLSDKKYPNRENRAAFFERVLERIGNLPGVEADGEIGNLPLAGNAAMTSFSVIGRAGQPEEGYDTDFDFSTPGYFRAIGTPLVKGRLFDPRDKIGAPRVVIINQAFARAYFPNEDPVGQRIHLEVFTKKIDEGWEIVGVVGDVRQRALGLPPHPTIYRPTAFSFFGGGGYLVVRTAGAPSAMAESVRKAIREVDPSQPVAYVRTMEEVIATSLASRRFILTVLGGFAAAALLLAAIGLYGVIAYYVSLRTREIGIRMALGATRGHAIAVVLRQGMGLVGLGVLLGMAGSLALARVLGNMLYEIKPTDPLTLSAVSLLLIGVGLLACLLPARRAALVDPIVALRHE
jgi:putative ABC transport system permease protein